MVSYLPGLALMKTTVLESMRTLSYFRLDTLLLRGPTFRSSVVSFLKGGYKEMKQRLYTGLFSNSVCGN